MTKGDIMNKRVRAIIVQGRKLLLVHRLKGDREYWVFPGGGLEDSDISSEDGLKRECKEELGLDIEVGTLFTEDSFNERFEFFYVCQITGGTLGTGTGPEFSRDRTQFGTYELQWVPIDDLPSKDVQPQKVRDLIVSKYQ